MLIDSHCHLTDPNLLQHPDGGVEGVLHRAKEAGVTECITIGTDLSDVAEALRLGRQFPNVYVAGGFHPGQVGETSLAQRDELAALLDSVHPQVVAVGEIGLDLHWRQDNLPLQRQVFAMQLELARERKLPVIIHARKATEECLQMLQEHRWPGMHAVFHCYSGTVEQYERIASLSEGGGYCTVSFTGVVTFKKADDARAVVKAVGLEGMILETDAPYLAPEPVRRVKVCEPAFVAHTAAFLDRFFDVPPGTVAQISRRNTVRLFGLKGCA